MPGEPVCKNTTRSSRVPSLFSLSCKLVSYIETDTVLPECSARLFLLAYGIDALMMKGIPYKPLF